MADISNTGASPAVSTGASPDGSDTSTVQVKGRLRPLARALLAAAAEIHAARRDGRLSIDRTRPADRRPAGREQSVSPSAGRHPGRQLAATPGATSPARAKPQPRPAGGSPVVESDSLGASS